MACERCVSLGRFLLSVCLTLTLTWYIRSTEAAIYRHTGVCLHKDALFKPGETFYRGCDKCYCHDSGFICLSPMKPTSWPQKCKRLPTECGYRVVYRHSPEQECRAYSWVW